MAPALEHREQDDQRHVAIVVSQNEKPLSTASATFVSHGVRSRATCRRIAESSRSVKPPTAVELWARIAQSSNTPNAMSQPVPVVPMCFGRGGGAPDGRRRRRVRVAVGGAGSCGAGDRRRFAVGRSRPRHRRSQQPLIFEPGSRDRAEVIGAVRDLGVQRPELRGRQAFRHRVDGIDEVRSPSINDLRAHQRCDVLGGLESFVVFELDEAFAVDGRIGGEQQCDVDCALAECLTRQRAAGVEAMPRA